MKNLFLIAGFVIMILSCTKIFAQKLGLESYFYTGKSANAGFEGIAGYNNKHDWHTEIRYNYDDLNTFSLYEGKSFSHTGKWSYEFTPMIGLDAGEFNGGSIALNTDIEYKCFDFSSQAQYTLSVQDKYLDYFYQWSELTYQFNDLFYAGVAVQQTKCYAEKQDIAPGLVAGITYKKWTFPLYFFRQPGNQNYFVLGVNWEWEQEKNPAK